MLDVRTRTRTLWYIIRRETVVHSYYLIDFHHFNRSVNNSFISHRNTNISRWDETRRDVTMDINTFVSRYCIQKGEEALLTLPRLWGTLTAPLSLLWFSRTLEYFHYHQLTDGICRSIAPPPDSNKSCYTATVELFISLRMSSTKKGGMNLDQGIPRVAPLPHQTCNKTSAGQNS